MMRLEGIDDILALTPLQQGMLFHTVYAPESSVYNLQMEFALEGDLDEGALEQAWCALVERHTALRTSFVWERVEKPYQVVHQHAHLKIARHDWRALSATEQDERRRSCLEEERTRLFDLTRPPLMRLALIVLSEHKFRLVWTFHHIILEGWSAAIILSELWKCYGDLRAHRSPDLPAVRPYAEFIRWLQRKDHGNAEAYWRERLEGFGTPTRLAIDRSIGSAPAEVKRVDSCSFTLSKNFTDALKGLARTHRVTLNTVVQGAWSILLSRYSGDQNVVFGAVLSGRPPDLPGVESIVGLFVNTLPARVNVDGDATLIPWLQALQLDQATMRQYEYSSLMQVRAWSDVPGGQPLFHTALAFQNWLGDSSSGQLTPDLQVAALESHETSDQPLTLQVMMGDTLTLNLVYDVERFDRAAVARMPGHLQTLLEAMVASPERRISELPLLTEAEREQLLVEWNRTATDYPRDRTIHKLFEEQAERTPDAVAVEYEGRRLSYGELNARANQLAHYLARHEVGPEVMVGICVERSLEMVVGILGILKAGGAYVPLDPKYPAPRLAMMLEDTATPVLLTHASLRDQLPAFGGRVVSLDVDWPEIARERQDNPSVAVSVRNLAYVIYTSGSTGRPKGTCIEHRSVVRLVKSTNYIELGPHEVFLQYSPISFDASTLELWGSLLNGGKLLVCPARQLSMEELGRVIREGGVSTLWLTAGLFNLMVDEQIDSLRGVRQLLAGGEALSVFHVRRALEGIGKNRLVNGYGPTENTTFTCCHVMTADSCIEQTVPIGRPISNTRVYILDPQMQPVPIGVCGELYIGGDGLAREYLHQPALTTEKFVADPFSKEAGARLYRTGDWVRYQEDGAIEFIGRRDNQVKVRGFRIELGEIEAGISRHPAIREAVVLAREDVPGDKRLVAYLVAENPAADLADQLRALIRTTMPEYMVPAHFVRLDALPLTENGKVDRNALPVPDASRRALVSGGHVAPRNDLEIGMATVWEKVLGMPRVGITDNFFDLGGNSLSALRAIVEMEQATGVEIDLGEVFRSPTISALVAKLGANATKNASVVVPLQPEGNGLPVFCICGINIYRDFAESLGKDQPVFGVYVAEEQAIVNEVIRGEKPEVSIDRLVEAYYKAITRFLPHGPYRLAGLSFGGILAIQLASKMRKSGAEVELVFLLDTVLPEAVHGKWAKWISYQAAEILKGNGPKKIRSLLTSLRNAIAKGWSQLGIRQRERRVDEAFRLRQEAAFLIAAEEWQAHPPVCDFRVILFRAMDLSIQGPHVELDEDLGWRRYLGDRLCIVDAIGGHRGIIEPPNVTELGLKARQYLAAQG